jgi:regulator of cell morphogenesis and NO signaling
MVHPHESDIVGDLVAADFRAAAIFERAGIDFCCGGRRSLADACHTAGVPVEAVIRDLTELPATAASDEDPRNWPIARLIDHILKHHHAYVRRSLPLISTYLRRLVEVHGTRHPELSRTADEFAHLQIELQQHMLKEERVLFPYLRELEAAVNEGRAGWSSPFGTVENPIRMMEREHDQAGDELHTIRQLTNDYRAPEDGCTTYRVAMAELQRFEQDLHTHVHLENNVLFPSAVTLERRLIDVNAVT